MRGDFFEFKPTHKLALRTNHRPVVRETKNAIWERIQLVDWSVSFAGREDTTLPEKLLREGPGILRWLVEGCTAWQRTGLAPPAAVRAATAAYRADMDALALFLAEVCVQGLTLQAPATDLYAAYQRWCQDNGERPATQTAFGRAMTERGFDRKPVNGRIRYFGVGLRYQDADDRDGPVEGVEGVDPIPGSASNHASQGSYPQKPSTPSTPSTTPATQRRLATEAPKANLGATVAPPPPWENRS
jgi:putative DNA primase/helicase